MSIPLPMVTLAVRVFDAARLRAAYVEQTTADPSHEGPFPEADLADMVSECLGGARSHVDCGFEVVSAEARPAVVLHA